jgi:hypothetical protein
MRFLRFMSPYVTVSYYKYVCKSCGKQKSTRNQFMMNEVPHCPQCNSPMCKPCLSNKLVCPQCLERMPEEKRNAIKAIQKDQAKFTLTYIACIIGGCVFSFIFFYGIFPRIAPPSIWFLSNLFVTIPFLFIPFVPLVAAWRSIFRKKLRRLLAADDDSSNPTPNSQIQASGIPVLDGVMRILNAPHYMLEGIISRELAVIAKANKRKAKGRKFRASMFNMHNVHAGSTNPTNVLPFLASLLNVQGETELLQAIMNTHAQYIALKREAMA